jgi:alpha-glucosidase
LYQIYPRSFADSDGDGIGDLPGITSRLGHLADLGVDGVWLSPFYLSPMADFGYDIADHCAVDPVFGTLADFDALVEAAHARGLRVLIDFVGNHTSDRHRWFAESRSGRDASRRDWYIWADPGFGGGPPNNWPSSFAASGPAWTLDRASGQYYLHSYTASQPDLNWHNPQVRAAMAGVLRFWLERGVDGFRLDAPHRLIKDPALTDNPPQVAAARRALGPGAHLLRHIDQPGVHPVLRELHAAVAAYGPGKLLLGEVGVADPGRWAAYYGRGDEIDLPLNFRFWSCPWSAAAFADAVAATEAVMPPGAWPVYALGNHDLPRLASRYGGDGHGQARARLAAMLLLTLRGTPLIYYGDEIAMTDVPVPAALARDPDGRDPARTPMQWAPGPGAGFCPPDAGPWLPADANADQVNVAVQVRDGGSTLTWYRRLLALRRAEPALALGSYTLLHCDDDVLAYERRHGHRRVTVALNFSGRPRTLRLPGAAGARVLLATGPGHRSRPAGPAISLAGHEGVALGASPADTKRSTL